MDNLYSHYISSGGEPYENVEVVGTVPTSPSIDLSFPEWNNVHKKFTGLAKTIVGAGATITPLEWTGVPINPLTLADDTRVINPTDYNQANEQAQGHSIGGNTEPDAQKKLYWMPWGKYDYASKVEPWVDPSPSPTPTPDPQPQPQPQPTPVVPPPVTKTDTLDPSNPTPPDPMKGKDIVFPVVPTITTNSKLFTVYNPSNGQLGDLGNYIWSAFTQTIVSLFQNPLDGIISLQQIWGNPIVGAPKNIYLGNLNSEVSAPVVVKRYDDIDMGSIAIPEYYKNALDYDATSIQIYLPFIGYRELDIRDVMASIIHLKYTIDYYTGCCLAHLSVYRNSIEVNFYEFEGCCSTSIPLTSADCSRLLTGITSAVVGAATIGPYGAVMGLSHMGSNVGRSGSFSRDAGVMGGKKPFVIISRMRSYDAGSYEKFYGYPANKTVKIGSLSGYVRVKDVHLDNFVATDTEKAEIERLLKQGVIV